MIDRPVLETGDSIDGRYRVLGPLGEGAYASVYRIKHRTLGSEHALKVLHVASPVLVKRLLLEGQVQATLNHPNIVTVTDALEVKQRPALVLELVDGPSLDAWLSKNRPTPEQALWLFRGILLGIGEAHANGIVHRDLKPGNVLLAPTNEGLIPKVGDFGLVKVLGSSGGTQRGAVMGTPEYMAPEQIQDSSAVDERADIFALGCILYELLTGLRPFAGTDLLDLYAAVLEGAFAPPSELVSGLPPGANQAVVACLHIDPDQRPDWREMYRLIYDGTVTGLVESGDRSVAIPGEPPSVGDLSPPTGPPDPTLDQPNAPRAPFALPTGPRRWAILVSLPVLAGVASFLFVLFAGRPPARTPGPPPAPRPEDALPPATPEEPHLEAAAPPASPVAEGVPPPSEAPKARPRIAEPAPTAPAPPDAPTTPAPASVVVEGDAATVVLVAADRRLAAGTDIPPGTYGIVATFAGNEPLPAGDVQLWPGDQVTITCSGFTMTCQVKR